MARSPGGPGYERYLLDDERVVVALHRHWAMVTTPVASAVAGLVFAVWVDLVLPSGAHVVSTVVWWLWLAVVAWTAWELVQWRREWFLATDKRLLLTQGLIAKNVAMMPLTKVTDLSYVRTLTGRVVGYGQFVLESAGQDQALREVSWIPQPDQTYRAICAEIFGSPDDDARDLPGHDDGIPGDEDADSGGWAPAWLEPQPDERDEVAAPRAPRATPSAVTERGGFSRAIPVTPPPRPDPSYDASPEPYESWETDPTGVGDPYETPDADGEPLYVSDDITRRQRADDTGPIPRYDD
ncbi:MAG: PH domain-containing protein [Actinomycetota bacterium]|nr:PH domain-containing protein [Actinomycetota bacterium]